jgi:DNA-binding winged helix-turn-helix (wHTH) protein/tetratricopeptide (TPR) repeat protein
MSAVPSATVRVAFGNFVLDRERRQVLRRDGVALALTPRLVNAIEFFVERPGQLIEKDTLLRELWPDRVVEDNSLSQLIHALRRALGDDGEQHRYLQTEARRGFRLVVPVERLEADSGPVRDDMAAPLRTPSSTLAVLPFLPLSADERDALLGLGMADTLTTRLSTLPRLAVRSLGSVRRLAATHDDAVQIGRALDVEWVVDGTLQRDGMRLRASARLLSVADGTAAWSEQFDAAWTDVFNVQDTIADRVARGLGHRLAHPVSGTRSIDAYQLYLAGLNHAQDVSGESLHKSIALFEHALRIDPRYALAHVGAAEAHRRKIFGADGAPAEIYAQMSEHVTRALDIAPQLADAHAQLGWLRYWRDHDWAAAERAFRHALELNPNLALAAFGLGFMLVVIGRRAEGMALVRTARELDPMSLLICTLEATFLLRGGDRESAEKRLARVLEFAPKFWVAHMASAAWQDEHGDPRAALASIELAVQLNRHTSQALALQGVMLARYGRRAEARIVLARLEDRSGHHYVPPTSIAAVQAALGYREAALASLERAFECNDCRLLHLREDRRWVTLRDEPRFLHLVERMNLAGLPPGFSPP